ncbi:MAG: uncharacterized protein QOC73_403 [Actinomycetota bacterium]|nr:uncharacterized protein [Actinomycetota bacterium]
MDAVTGRPIDVDEYGPACTVDVPRAIMMHRWDTLTFLHWSYDPDVVARLLPPQLILETFDGLAWVGLIPFNMRVYLPHTPSVPWASRFCETNVRTYVRDRYGRSGIWFFSLDASRLGAVLAARGTFRLPYMWSDMKLKKNGNTIAYSCRRRWPGPRGAKSRVVVDIGEPIAAAELTAHEHFLTARWKLFSMHGRWQRYGDAQHDPWQLHRATVRELDDQLVAAAGLPQPTTLPLAHYSPGVDVRIGPPHRL